MSGHPAAECSAEKRRFSPDMKVRWLPTVAGKIVVGGDLPFGGFDTRSEAVAAARKHLRSPPSCGDR